MLYERCSAQAVAGIMRQCIRGNPRHQRYPRAILLAFPVAALCCAAALAGNTAGRSRDEVLAEYRNYYLTSALTTTEQAWTGDAASCNAGTVSQLTYDRTLQRINYFRRLVGEPGNIVYESTRNAKCQQAALMCLANRALSHAPPDTWSCYTAEGAEGCGNSNLSTAFGSNAMTNFMADNGANNGAAGHRRWILYSRARTSGIGSASSYCALWTLGNGSNPIADTMPDFIAFPPAGYVPGPLVFSRWSFGIPGADFRSASVTMTDSAGRAVALTREPVSHNTYGDNTVVWVPSGISTTSPQDVRYTVTVSGILSAPNASYTYTVIIANPSTPVVARPAAEHGTVRAGAVTRREIHDGRVLLFAARLGGVAYDTAGRLVAAARIRATGRP